MRSRMAERHNGVWGGCWCTYFHRHPDSDEERRALGHRDFKRRLVEAGRAHAALAFDGDVAVAWAQFGTVPELWNIHHRKEWEKGVARMPDYRITCLFVDSGYRRAGMAAVAVQGALALIAAAGGGLVEAYPHDLPEGKKTSASFLYNATRTMYQRLGFSYEHSKGKGNCVMAQSSQPPRSTARFASSERSRSRSASSASPSRPARCDRSSRERQGHARGLRRADERRSRAGVHAARRGRFSERELESTHAASTDG